MVPTATTPRLTTLGEPVWVPLDQSGNLLGLARRHRRRRHQHRHVPAAAFGQAIIDSGGPDLGLPQAAFTKLTTMIAASPAFMTKLGDASWFNDVNCTVLPETRAELDAELPKLTVQIGSPTVSIDLPATAAYLQSYLTPEGMTYCPALFVSPFTDLGNTLIRAGIVIHDREHGRLGFAPAPPCVDSAARVIAHPPNRRVHMPTTGDR